MVGGERRRFERVAVDAEGLVIGPDGKGLACRVSDVSIDGMKVHLPSQLEESASVTLRVYIACDLTMEMEALIAWHKAIRGENVYGLDFSNAQETEKESLMRMVQAFFPSTPDEFLKQYLTPVQGGSDVL